MKLKEFFKSEKNWHQGSYCPDKSVRAKDLKNLSKNFDCLCLFGALLYCYRGEYNRRMEVWKLINEEVDRGMSGWNDDPKRTFQDVRDLVEKLDI